MDDTAEGGRLPLAGKVVVLIHPAWVACGSHQVFASQARAYRALGATLVTLAANDVPALAGSPQRARYTEASADIVADHRDWAAMSPLGTLSPGFAAALYRRLHGDRATLRVEVGRRTPVPPAILALPRIDLVHCNHFFCMPLARRVAAGTAAPIVLESHDVQSQQYEIQNNADWTLWPSVGTDAMMAVELAEMEHADLLVHLNTDEAAVFERHLPDARHRLLYPAVAPVGLGVGGRDILIVAAANYPNFLSLEWFLRDVMPLLPPLPIRIVGKVEGEVRTRAPALYQRHASLFAGAVDDLDTAYRAAGLIVLPTVSGHGVSIKTIEALSTGTRIVATTHAFRGMTCDPATLDNAIFADDPAEFAAAIRMAAGLSPLDEAACRTSGTRGFYDRVFSDAAYRDNLRQIVGTVLA